MLFQKKYVAVRVKCSLKQRIFGLRAGQQKSRNPAVRAAVNGAVNVEQKRCYLHCLLVPETQPELGNTLLGAYRIEIRTSSH